MKQWWDNPKYHSSSVDNKIAAWADHCQTLEYEIDMLKTANVALSQQILDAINILDGNDDPIDTNDDSQPELLLKLSAHLEYFALLKLKLADEKLSKQDNRIAELENCIRQILKTDDKHGKRVRFDHARLCLNGPIICGEG